MRAGSCILEWFSKKIQLTIRKTFRAFPGTNLVALPRKLSHVAPLNLSCETILNLSILNRPSKKEFKRIWEAPRVTHTAGYVPRGTMMKSKRSLSLDSQEPPDAHTVLPTTVSMDHPLPGKSRTLLVVRCVEL